MLAKDLITGKEVEITEENAGYVMTEIAPVLVPYLDNEFVKAIHGDKIFYNDDFYAAMVKLIRDEGKSYVEAYQALGFDVNVLGTNRANQAGKNAMKQAEKDTSFTARVASYDGSVPLDKMPKLDEKEQMAYLTSRVLYLESMLEIQKKNSINIGGERYYIEGEDSKVSPFEALQNFMDGWYYQTHKDYLTVVKVCKMFGVSDSGYYDWVRRISDKETIEKKKLEEEELMRKIREIVRKCGYVPGKRTLKDRLFREFNICISIKLCKKMMKKMNLVANKPLKDAYKHQATHDHEKAAPADNLLHRNFYIGPRKVVLTDITYLYYGENREPFYFCAFHDPFTKENLGRSCSQKMTVEDLVRPAYDMMMKTHGNELKGTNAFIHSDQGSQYTSTTFHQMLSDDGFIQSMSGRANSLDNSPMESFFGQMKKNILKVVSRAKDYETAAELVDGYIEQYNTKDYQYELGGLTPVEYYDYVTTGVYPCPSYFGVDASKLESLKNMRKRNEDRARNVAENGRKKQKESKAQGKVYNGKDPLKIINRDIALIEKKQKQQEEEHNKAKAQMDFLENLLKRAEGAREFVKKASNELKEALYGREEWHRHPELNYIFDMKGMF